jgi:fatty acid desaturase
MTTATRTRTHSATAHLSEADIAAIGAELDAIRASVIESRGAADAAYIRRVIAVQRGLEVGGRAALLVSLFPPAWFAGTAALSVAKILENMEIGHNVLHGQWDWMRDPDIHSTTWEWDAITPATAWQHTHNDLHHTWTNVVGKDRDVGYTMLRISAEQPWKLRHLANPVMNAVLAPFFEWGIAAYDLEMDQVIAGKKSKRALLGDLRNVGKKAAKQVLKDYVVTPVLAGPSFVPALAGTFTANTVRNLWSHAIIFCGHFPDGAEMFTEDMLEGETRGDWYVRQMLGSANLEGSQLFHVLSGNLSHQIEHHLFPDLPSNRYAEIAPQVRDLCERYDLRYTSGPLSAQLLSTWSKLFKLALPGGSTGAVTVVEPEAGRVAA